MSLGSNDPSMREIPGETMGRADAVFVDDYDLCLRVGDVADAIEEGHLTEDAVLTMTELVTSGEFGPAEGDAVSVVKSVGSFALDIPVSERVLERAVADGRGSTFDLQGVEGDDLD